MLSDKVIEVLNSLRYRPDAGWHVNIAPFGDIMWNDEFPMKEQLPSLIEHSEDMTSINNAFCVRIKIWNGEALSAQEQEFWIGLQRLVPNWPLFKRVSLTPEQMRDREEAERQLDLELEALEATQDGI